MALQVDTSGNAAGASPTVALTILNIPNRILIAGVFDFATDGVTAVKWNTNETMTLLDKITQINSGQVCYYYYLLNPTPATANVTLTTSAGTVFGIYAAGFSGAKQQAPTPTTKSTATSGTTYTSTLTSSYENAYQVGAFFNANFTLTAGAATTLITGTGTGLYRNTSIVALPSSNVLTTTVTGGTDNLAVVSAMIESVPNSTGIRVRNNLRPAIFSPGIGR